jgi:hypothetical protein
MLAHVAVGLKPTIRAASGQIRDYSKNLRPTERLKTDVMAKRAQSDLTKH